MTDEVGQPLAEGTSDIDLHGDTGAEQLIVAVPRPGPYMVVVEALFGGGSFDLVASWMDFPGVALSDDDWGPSVANELPLGSTQNNTVNTEGDLWDWYSVTAESSGVLAVVIESDDGDLVLEVFGEADFSEPASRSDQDIDGNTGNDSVAVSIAAGQTLYVKVSSLFPSMDEPIAYTIRAGVM